MSFKLYQATIYPESLQDYLESKFGNALEEISNAILRLAKFLPPSQLAGKACTLYQIFSLEIPPGKKG